MKRKFFPALILLATLVAVVRWVPNCAAMHAQGPLQYEVACPVGTVALNQTLNTTTGDYRAYLCVDRNGKITMQPDVLSPKGPSSFAVPNIVADNSIGLTMSFANGAGVQMTPTNLNLQGWGPASGNVVLTNTPLLNWSTTFASLGTATNGRQEYCSDCTSASEGAACAGSGTGKMAMAVNSAWICF